MSILNLFGLILITVGSAQAYTLARCFLIAKPETFEKYYEITKKSKGYLSDGYLFEFELLEENDIVIANKEKL